MKVTKNPDGKSLTIKRDGKSFDYFFVWLRDHCRCPDCYNQVTSQRKINVTDIPADIMARNCQVEGEDLKIVWQDGHKSVYSVSFLENVSYENYLKRLQRNYILWTKDEIFNLPVSHVPFEDLLGTEEGVLKTVKSLVDYGIAFVENVPADIKATEEAVVKLSHVQHTLFGGMWEFSDSMDHQDTAYTTGELGLHTDNTYFTEAAGLQVLHCLNHTGTGGMNMLVDGFKAAEILRASNPDAFSRLATTCLEAEYLEPGYHHTYTAPVIKLHPVTKQLEQIRFNVYDRAPICLPKDQILQHYEDYKLLASIITNPSLEWKFKLNPGTILIFDNFRVLHGRTSYTGHRTMCGCYLGRGDFLSKARVLNLI